MKKFKSGFTLAEVLITLAIIGIVAAIVMPAVITSYQFKTVGVKLAKFQSTVENAARAYVVSNDSFEVTSESGSGENTVITGEQVVSNFVNEAFIFKSIYAPTSNYDKFKGLVISGSPVSGISEIGLKGTDITTGTGMSSITTNENNIGIMKDNTKVQVLSMNRVADADKWDADDKMKMIQRAKVGSGAFILRFDPAVSGLQNDIQKSFDFVVTELGYMFPSAKDDCLWQIYNADFVTNSNMFKDKYNGSANACKKQ